MAVEGRQCPRCGNFDSFVPLRDAENDKRTTELGGRTFGVVQQRCVACALSDLVEREAARTARADTEPLPGEPAMGDGRMFIAQVIDEPSEQGEPDA